MTDIFAEQIATPRYQEIDVEFWVNLEKFYFECMLIDGSKVFVAEEYGLLNYRLEIQHYFYGINDQYGKMIISFDNAPQYPELATFPHHKHLYPKSKHRPIGFSGDFADALEEIKWILETR